MKFVIRSPFIHYLHETMLIDSEMTQEIENESKEVCIAFVDGVLAFFQETVFFYGFFFSLLKHFQKVVCSFTIRPDTSTIVRKRHVARY